MNVAIIGAGLQARRRAPAVVQAGDRIVAVAAAHEASARALADQFNADFEKRWSDAITRADVEAVLVLTPPDSHAMITIAALEAGKHVLCEKPLAKTMDEAEAMTVAAGRAGRTLKCGFNHRHHPAIERAHQIVASGEIGVPIFGRCRYGIIGRPGYEQEWRADPAIVSGGQFMEQGIHAVDLFRWFLGDIVSTVGMTTTSFFPLPAGIEDNGFALLRAKSGAVASIHSSITQWRNLFSFEVYCHDGFVQVEGLGGGYGVEQLIVGRRDFDGPFAQEVTDYRGGDNSWRGEWDEFVAAIREEREPLGNGRDGIEAMRIVFDAYMSSVNSLNHHRGTEQP